MDKNWANLDSGSACMRWDEMGCLVTFMSWICEDVDSIYSDVDLLISHFNFSKYQKALGRPPSREASKRHQHKKRGTLAPPDAGCDIKTFSLCRNLTSSPPMISIDPQADVALIHFVDTGLIVPRLP